MHNSIVRDNFAVVSSTFQRENQLIWPYSKVLKITLCMFNQLPHVADIVRVQGRSEGNIANVTGSSDVVVFGVLHQTTTFVELLTPVHVGASVAKENHAWSKMKTDTIIRNVF